MLLIGTSLRIDNRRYETAASELRPLGEAAYTRVFPDAVVPVGASLRLRSERISVEGLTQGSGPGVAAVRDSALETFQLLHAVTANVPPEVKLHVDEITLDSQGLKLAGRTTSHHAAGELVRTLNLNTDLSVAPPRTKLRTDKTVDFSIRATRGDAEDDR
jgi:hypothetical protein